MEELRIGFYGLLVFNIAFGFLFGTFPLIAGIRVGDRKRGFLGFVLSIAGGALLGFFLSYPLAMLYCWMILRAPATDTMTSSDAAPADNTV